MTAQRAEIDTQESGVFTRPWARRAKPSEEALRELESAILLVRMSNLLAEAAPRLTLAEVLTVACDKIASHLALAGAVLEKRVAGQSRTYVWRGRGAVVSGRVGAPMGVVGSPTQRSASVSVGDERLGLFAKLTIESNRWLDAQDREFLHHVLRQLLGAPAAPQSAARAGSGAMTTVLQEVFADQAGNERHNDEREDRHDVRLQVRGSRPASR